MSLTSVLTLLSMRELSGIKIESLPTPPSNTIEKRHLRNASWIISSFWSYLSNIRINQSKSFADIEPRWILTHHLPYHHFIAVLPRITIDDTFLAMSKTFVHTTRHNLRVRIAFINLNRPHFWVASPLLPSPLPPSPAKELTEKFVLL